MSVGAATFTLTVAVVPSATGTISNTANVGSSTNDPTPADNSGVAATLVDGAPTITNITDQMIAEDGTTAAVPFTIGDVGTAPGSLTLSVGSSNQSIVPDANIVLGGSGANRTVTVTPVANQHGGPVTITVTVSDGGLSSSDTFTLSVTSVNDAPTIDPIANQTVGADVTVGPLPIAIDDVDHAASGLTLSAVSSNHALVPDAAITFGGSGGEPHGDDHATSGPERGDDDHGHRERRRDHDLDRLRADGHAAPAADVLAGGRRDGHLLRRRPADRESQRQRGASHRDVLPGESGQHRRDAYDSRTVGPDGCRSTTLPGLEAAAVSAQVRSDSGVPLAVERTQFWGVGSYGGHTETALTGAATRWYFAEGAQGYFTTFVLVANPQSAPVDLTLTFLREGETPVTTTVQVAPFSRTTIPAGSLPELADRSFGIIVDATQPVVAERAMYFGTTAARPWTGGAAAAGATTPSSTWYFAEGATGRSSTPSSC